MTDEERVELAVAALAEVADPETVGPLVDAAVPAEGVIDLRFAAVLPGYVDWFWTVSTSDLEGVEPTVLELELLPGPGALVAPPWVPWEERLAEWRRSHSEDADPDGEDEALSDADDDDDDDDDLDGEDGLDADPDDVLDDGDVDGVDVDAIADEDDEDDEDDDEDDEGERTP